MNLKKAYLYLVSAISLVVWVIGAITLVNLLLKLLIMNDDYGNNAYYLQNELPISISMLLVGGLVWWFHWRQAKMEV